LKTINLLFFYLLREWKFDLAWNYKKWGDFLGCGSSHLCLYWCWDILYQIGDLLELWSMVQKIPKCWWVLKIQCTKARVCMSIEIIIIIFKKIRTVSTLIASWFIWINKKSKNKKHTNPWPNPKGRMLFFSKNTSKLPFLAQEAQTKINLFFCIFNHKILP
jgi:hypothetical protein